MAVQAAESASPPVEKREAHESPASGEQSATAILFGEKITARPGPELNGKIVGALLKRYTEENEIRPTDEEIAAFTSVNERRYKESIEQWKRGKEAIEEELRSATLSDAERKAKEKRLATYTRLLESEGSRKTDSDEARKANRLVAEHFVLSWKIHQSLFKKYGGRVIFQQAGPEPLDALREFLRDSEKAGQFKLLTEEAREKFWDYYLGERKHRFMSEEAGRESMTTPWWLGAAKGRE